MAMTGQYVKEKIEGIGLTLSQVARNLGISPQALHKRLNVEDMKVGVLMEIAKASGKSVSFFLETSSTSIQQQTNSKGISRNTQANVNKVSVLSETDVKLGEELADCQQRLQEKDQIIVDLRRTISLYEQLSKKGI